MKDIIESLLHGSTTQTEYHASSGDDCYKTETRKYSGGVSEGDYMMLLFLYPECNFSKKNNEEKIYISFKENNKVTILGVTETKI